MSDTTPATVTASYALAVLRATEEGTDAPVAWNSPTDRLRYPEMRAVWDTVLGAHGADPHTGLLVGDGLKPDNLHILGHIVLTSASLADAADAAQRYHPLVSQAGTVTLHRHRDVSRLCYRPDVGPGEMYPQQVEAVVTGMVRAARWIAGDAWAPLAVSFSHARAGLVERYTHVLGCTVSFDAPVNAITVSNEDLGRRRPLHDPALNAVHRAYAERLLHRLSPAATSVSMRVEQWLSRTPLQGVGVTAPARELAVSPRALRRALHAEGTSWRVLLDRARHSRTRHLLETTDLPLDRVARLAGLSDASALVRAFRRWEGVPPGAYRDRRRTATDASGASRGAAGAVGQ
ncbi:AraC family transcriptional regulator ligand-binding domain-containing protein [Streptomyces sp. AM6-12]|uniref:AraC family transcriptional regulator n=1 Tax=Streptomyces sp. AM6-12 TaxID=3345149 RepID=UPI00379ADE64